MARSEGSVGASWMSTVTPAPVDRKLEIRIIFWSYDREEIRGALSFPTVRSWPLHVPSTGGTTCVRLLRVPCKGIIPRISS